MAKFNWNPVILVPDALLSTPPLPLSCSVHDTPVLSCVYAQNRNAKNSSSFFFIRHNSKNLRIECVSAMYHWALPRTNAITCRQLHDTTLSKYFMNCIENPLVFLDTRTSYITFFQLKNTLEWAIKSNLLVSTILSTTKQKKRI